MFEAQKKYRAIRKKYAGASIMNMDMISGLPIPAGSLIYVINPADVIVLWRETDNQEWHLPKKRIMDAAVVKGSALKIRDGLNKTGFIGGALIAGLPGAIIGALVPNDNYFIIVYSGTDNERKEIILRVPPAGMPLAKRIAKEYGGRLSAGANSVNVL